MEKGYNKLFWGLFITTFNITIGMITILPAFIGWIIIFSGLSELQEESFSSDLSKPKIIVTFLILTSLLGGLLPFVGGIYIDRVLNFRFYPIMILVLEFILFHKILEESVQNFYALKRQDLGVNYTQKDRSYMVFMGTAMVLMIISLTTNFYGFYLLGLGMVILTTIYLLTVLYSLSKEDYDIEKTENFGDEDSPATM